MWYKNVLLAALVVGAYHTLSAQQAFFEQGYGSSLDECAHAVIVDENHHVALAGYMVDAAHKKEFALIYTDSMGQHLATQTVGGTEDDVALDIVATQQNDFILVGKSRSFGYGGEDIYIVRTDTADTLWTRVIGTADDEYLSAVISDGDAFIAVGSQYHSSTGWDVVILKFDTSGYLLWYHTEAVLGDQRAAEVLALDTGGYAIAVTDYGLGIEADLSLWLTNGLGEMLQSHSVPRNGHEEVRGLVRDAQKGFALAGMAEITSTDQDVFVALFDSSGTLLWQRTYGDSALDEAHDIIRTWNGFTVVGNTTSYGEGLFDMWCLTLDSIGDSLYSFTYGGDSVDFGHAIAGQEGVLYLAGYNTSYGLGESGNVYLTKQRIAGLTSEDPVFQEGWDIADCRLKRALWVTDFQNTILGNTAREDDLLTYTQDHDITYLILDGVKDLFKDPSPADLQQLSDFIIKAKNRDLGNIIEEVGALLTYKSLTTEPDIFASLQGYMETNVSFNYQYPGKFNTLVLEHEFWNPNNRNQKSFQIAFSSDHLRLLDSLVAFNNRDANITSVDDYISRLFDEGDDYHPQYGRWGVDNISNQQSRAEAITSRADRIFLTWYMNDRKWNGGSGSGPLVFDRQRQVERTLFFGQASSQKVVIYPLLNTRRNSESTPQPYSPGEHPNDIFLGKWFAQEGHWSTDPATRSFKTVETAFLSTFSSSFYKVDRDNWKRADTDQLLDPATYPSLSERLAVNGFVYFKYDPYHANQSSDDPIFMPPTNSLTNQGRVACPDIANLPRAHNRNPAFKRSPTTGGTIVSGEIIPSIKVHLHPNPAQQTLHITLTDAQPAAKPRSYTLYLFSVTGQLVWSKPIIPSKENLVDVGLLPRGLYFYALKSPQTPLQQGKLILQ